MCSPTGLALTTILLAAASCDASSPTHSPGPTTGGTTSPALGTGGAIGTSVGSGGATTPLAGTGGGPGSGGRGSTGGAAGKGGSPATGGTVGVGGTTTPGGAGGKGTGGAGGKGGSTGGQGGAVTDAGANGACTCTGGTTTLECFCTRWSCPDSLSAYGTDGGSGFSFVTLEEFADCDLVRVNGLSPGMNPDQWVFERSTGRLVGGRYASDMLEACPWDREAGSSRILRAGRFPETTCVRTRCVTGTMPQGMYSCPDGGA